jgi:hypothetical protein
MKPNADQLQFISHSVNPFTNPARYGDTLASPKIKAPPAIHVSAPDVPRIMDTTLQTNRQVDLGRP